ncbi:hypothetical protein [Burkholderia phage FLC9]|nr:hypothetical protein [Burkholderia phage FLC9]
MELEQSGLYQEVLAVTASPNPVHFAYSAIIHLNDLNVDLSPLKLVQYDVNGDYESNYSDEIMVRLLVPAGKYAYQIYPNQTNIDITIIKQPLMETGDNDDTSKTLQQERFTAHLVDKGDLTIAGNGRNVVSEDDMDRMSLMEVDFQLVDKALEQVRMKSYGNILRAMTVEDAIKGILTQQSSDIIINNQQAVQGVQMVDADNKTVRDHIVIPPMKLIGVPKYIHEKCGGVYGAGMGYYLQDGIWHIYPCYDPTRYNDAASTCTIIVIPESKYPNLDRTYRVSGSNLVILATGQVKTKDSSDSKQLTFGNGLRFADASKIMEGFTTTKNNKTLAARGASNSEFVSVPRPNGLNNVPISPNRLTGNPYLEYSALAARNGGLMGLVWEHSEPSLIVPGMLCSILYLSDDTIQQKQGVILKKHDTVQMAAPGLTVARHITRTALSIFTKSQLQGQSQSATSSSS